MTKTKSCRIQDLPLSPVRPMESAQIDPCLSSGHTMEDAELSKCVSGTPDALCSAAEQATKFKGYVLTDDMSAADSRDSFGTVDYTHKDPSGAFADLGAVNFMQPLAPDGTEDNAEEIEAQTASDPFFCEYGNRTDALAQSMRAKKSRSPRRHGEEREPFGLTSVHLSHQFGFRDATLWCWKCGGWSAGSWRASR